MKEARKERQREWFGDRELCATSKKYYVITPSPISITATTIATRARTTPQATPTVTVVTCSVL